MTARRRNAGPGTVRVRSPGRGADGAARRAFPAAATLAGLTAVLLTVPRAASGQEWLEMTTARQAAGEEAVSVSVVYGAGRLSVGAAEEGLLYRARMRYDAGSFRPVRDFERTGDGARVRLGVEGRGEDRALGLDLDWDSLDLSPLSLGNLDLDGGEAGEVDVGLSRGVPTRLDVRVGAAENTMVLGGLPLEGLRVATVASETLVTFDRPNPVTMEEMEIRAGAADLEVRGVGNARVRRIRVENAVGEVTLDFSGRWARNTTASVKTGLGAVTLRIPAGLGVKLEKSTVLSSFSGLGLERAEDGSYRSGNWDEAEHRLRLEVDAAFGSIDVEPPR